MTDETIWHIATDTGGDWYADTTADAVDCLTQGLPPQLIESRRNVLEVEFEAIARHGGTGYLPLTSHGLGWTLTIRQVTREFQANVVGGAIDYVTGQPISAGSWSWVDPATKRAEPPETHGWEHNPADNTLELWATNTATGTPFLRYWVDLDRWTTHAAELGTIQHVAGKRWADDTVIAGLVRLSAARPWCRRRWSRE